MPTIHVFTREGTKRSIAANAGTSVMETIRDSGINGILAICGGNLSCATCHVYVDEASLDKFPKIGDAENDLLDGADSRQPNSRLSCQITVNDKIDGVTFSIAPE
jgi:2Fe-2S ferredoxin